MANIDRIHNVHSRECRLRLCARLHVDDLELRHTMNTYDNSDNEQTWNCKLTIPELLTRIGLLNEYDPFQSATPCHVEHTTKSQAIAFKQAQFPALFSK